MQRTVVIRQVDLDTATTALLFGVSAADRILAAPRGADEASLRDPAVLCIECGGSGETDRGNFDHHDTDLPLPPACVQALAQRDSAGPDVRRLVDYAAAVDLGRPTARAASFPTLSAIFSGLRLSVPDPRDQLLRGLRLLRTLLDLRLDPFGTLPDLPQWRGYAQARREENEGLVADLTRAEFFTLSSGLRAGRVESRRFGALGGLYRLGCAVAVAHRPLDGAPGLRKCTIGSTGPGLRMLARHLNAREPGWGGPAQGRIIASPFGGTALTPWSIAALVSRHV